MKREGSWCTESLVIAYLYYAVHESYIHGIRDKIITYTFDIVVVVFASSDGRTPGICKYALDIRVLFL